MSQLPPPVGTGTAAEAARARRALALICGSVLLASATWFSGTAAVGDLQIAWGLDGARAAWMTAAVQLGFVVGTFAYAMLNLADVFAPRRVYIVSTLAGAAANLAFAWWASGFASGVTLRFLTGLTLAGVYPVAMKLVASWFRTGLGWRLGWMVGALGLGTASPYLSRALAPDVSWQVMVSVGSGCAVVGALLMAAIGADGPYQPAPARFEPRMAPRLFRVPAYRWTALGYFGHMWELYALWGLSPFFLRLRFSSGPGDVAGERTVLLLAFATVAVGAVGCTAGGWVSRRVGERRVALASLLVSGMCCLLSPWSVLWPAGLLVSFFLVWGFFVVADSPQFSALAVRAAPAEYIGTALTVQNGIGFLVTVVSLQIVPWLAERWGWRFSFVPLAAGAFLGAAAMRRLRSFENAPAAKLR